MLTLEKQERFSHAFWYTVTSVAFLKIMSLHPFFLRDFDLDKSGNL